MSYLHGLESEMFSYEAPEVYDLDDPDRLQFLKDNVVSLLKERDQRIARQKDAIQRLERSRNVMRKELSAMRGELAWHKQKAAV